MTRRCEIIQWLSIFFGFAIHHNLQYYQYPQYRQYRYDTNTYLYTNTITVKCVWNCPTIYFGFAIRYFSISSCQIHKDIWKIFGHRSVIGCFQPFGPPRHQLMYTYYQFVPPRCKWLYNDTAPHTANHTDHIRSTIQTVRATYGSVEINAILPETRSWIIPDQVSLPQITILQFVQGVVL